MKPPGLLTDLLKNVSRSFYLTLRILPRAVRPQISLSYLLARASDTIADTDALPPETRLRELARFREALEEEGGEFSIEEVARGQASESERMLLQRMPEVLRVFREFAPADRREIRRAIRTIVSGQELDLIRFGAVPPGRVIALREETELDDYTYRVAGCVGEFWTRLCLAHVLQDEELDREKLLEDGIRYGKGLQLVNILRDLPFDLRNGRCYLPSEVLAGHQLTPEDLLLSANEERFRRVYPMFLDTAEAHLAAGRDYMVALPFRFMRLRLACAWPLLIGIETLRELRRTPVLGRTSKIKISRTEVRRILVRSILYYPWRAKWEGLFHRDQEKAVELEG